MSTSPSAQLLGVVEEALVGHRAFGDSAYILDRFNFCSSRRLGVIATHVPSARRLMNALRRADGNSRNQATGNTVVRCAIQHAHTQVETDTEYGLSLADCEKIFEETALHLQLGKPGTPLESGAFQLPRFGGETYHGWIWTEDHPDDLFGRSFRFLIKQNYGDYLCTPSAEEVASLRKAEQLLRTLLPSLAPSALGHAHLIGLFAHDGAWKGKASSSQIKVGGTIFLGRWLLRNPWIVAEHLLHESLHQKLYDFRHGHTLLEPDFAKRGAPRVCSPWNPEELNRANHWDTHRAVAAFHVYVQLYLLTLSAEKRATELEDLYGAAGGMIDSRKAFERAWYLGEQLKDVSWNELGLAGRRLVDWLMSILSALEPSPPPRGAYFHLVLDLYERESKKIEAKLITDHSTTSTLVSKLVPLAKDEVTQTRRILRSIDAESELQQFNHALSQFADIELGAKYSKVRGLIARSLVRASPDGYGLKCTFPGGADPNDLVRQMVLSASQRLYVTLEGVPEAVAAAKRRAHELRFGMSCNDRVGRLLAVLAGAVPSGGRILELGTGVGVGTAWITAGLSGRSDVEVISVEVDRALSEAASEWRWPAYVRIVTVDALDVLGQIGAFNLMFVDAAPIKHGNIESAIKVLCPGGVLVVDDLAADTKMTDLQRTQIATLRRLLLQHPELQAVELDWASGVILATQSCRLS
jgi:predicted O-methyltransferase YrrM